MKILHLMLACFYIDNYSYQENYLPKHHKMQGHDVEIVASLFTFDESGKGKWLPEAQKYRNEYDIPVTRLAFSDCKLAVRLRKYKGLVQELDRFAPNVIFVHGLQFSDITIVADYCKKHPGIKVFVDNHSDFSNSASNWLSKNILHKIYWRRCARRIEPHTTRFYGVLPARVDFLVNVYKIPKSKVGLLVMGADDEMVTKARKPGVRQMLRQQYQLKDDDFVVVTGGKIDHNKPQVLQLMEAVNSLEDSKIKLCVFGNVRPELQERFQAQLGDRVLFVGWKRSAEIYEQFAMADLVAFPGLHSVLWEQAVAMGKPCAFRRIKGFEHIDVGGNCVFFEEDTIVEYQRTILQAKNQILQLKELAEARGLHTFSYMEIAKRSLED